MNNSTILRDDCQPIIDFIETTSDTLTGRGGLSLFVRYLGGVRLVPHIERLFGSMRKSDKGQPVTAIFKQQFCSFLDRKSRHMVSFDDLKRDEGYVASIESDVDGMLSSHAVKRFFQAFRWPRIWLFRRLLQKLFLWRLNLRKPDVITLGIDTMVMDNDEATSRHGVEPTYKKVKGLQPLQMTWGSFVIDAVFRGGDKHSDHSDTVLTMGKHVVSEIRKSYREDVPIVIRLDSGFFDQKLFEVCERLGIGYIVGGKLYKDIKEYVRRVDASASSCHENNKQTWDFVEFGDCRGSLSQFRRATFCRPRYEEAQQFLECARPDTMLYSNLGMRGRVDEQLRKVGKEHLLDAQQIIASYHMRGCDELVHRALKEFASEMLPFKGFAPNAAFDYTMLTSFFLYKSFKEDVCEPVVPVTAYATTVRRRLIDFAVKIVSHAGRIALKVTTATWKQQEIYFLWIRSGAPLSFAWT